MRFSEIAGSGIAFLGLVLAAPVGPAVAQVVVSVDARGTEGGLTSPYAVAPAEPIPEGIDLSDAGTTPVPRTALDDASVTTRVSKRILKVPGAYKVYLVDQTLRPIYEGGRIVAYSRDRKVRYLFVPEGGAVPLLLSSVGFTEADFPYVGRTIDPRTGKAGPLWYPNGVPGSGADAATAEPPRNARPRSFANPYGTYTPVSNARSFANPNGDPSIARDAPVSVDESEAVEVVPGR